MSQQTNEPKDMVLPLQKPFNEIAIKWVKYAQEDCDPNDIAYAVNAAIFEALNSVRMNGIVRSAMNEDEFIDYSNELSEIKTMHDFGNETAGSLNRMAYLESILSTSPWKYNLGTKQVELKPEFK